LPLFGQASPSEQLWQALVLEQQGRFEDAIREVRPLAESHQLNGVELGRAFIMLGFAYRGEGEISAARSAFEQSLHILGPDGEHLGDYASALDNYAALFSDAGQFDIARPMWLKAFLLREQIGDHAAAARSLLNLAGLALARKHLHEARDYLKEASGEMKLASDATDGDSILFLETQAWLALAERRVPAAIAGFQQALEICKRVYGDEHWLTGWEYMLRGKAFAQSGEISRAIADMTKGVAIFDHALGRKNPKYVFAQLAYAQLLDRAGSHAEAARLRAVAEQDVKQLYSSQCAGCTINIAGFQ
jgi:tetratricopeptide (TPR) repeat protein